MPPTVYLSVPSGRKIPEALIRRAVSLALQREEIEEGELSIAFLEDEPIRVLNERWRGHDWIPDVLSFALHDPGEPPIGDIYIGFEQAARQAEEQGVTEREELVRLAVHGVLHVLGYAHPETESGRAKSELFRKQEAVVREVVGE